MAMAVDPPIASTSALPPPPTPLPVVTTINENSRIIPAPAFVPKGLLAAIAIKPIPRRYTSLTETRPGIWVNAEKACNLANYMEVTLMISMLKCLETHITDVILPPQDLSLKRQTPSLDFIFTEDDFPYLPGSGTPSKRQCIDDGTMLLGSPTLPLTFTRDFDPDYFMSVPIFIDHEPTADYIKQSFIWRCNVTSVMEQPLVLSHLILSTMPLPSYQMNYPTLQFGCYGTALYLIFYILSFFGLVDIIIRFDSCLALLHTADSMPSHYFILLTLKPYSYSAKLYSYSAMYFVIYSFFHILSSYLLISDSSDSRIIFYWRISGPYLIG